MATDSLFEQNGQVEKYNRAAMKELTGTVTDSAMEIDPPLEHNVQIENDNRVAMKKAPKTLKAIIEHLSRVPKNPFIIACVEPGVKDLRPAIRTCKSFKSKLHPDKGGPKDDRLPLIKATWALNELTSPSAGDYHYTEEYDPNETWTYDETPNPPLQQYHLEAYAKAKPHIMKALMDSNQKDLSAIDKIDDETWKTDEEHKSDPLGTYDIQEYVNTVHTFWTEIQKALDSESPAINRRVTELNDEITSIFDKKQYPADWKVVFRVTGDEAHMDAPLMKSQKKRSYRANKRALAGSAIARSTDYSIRGLQIRTQLIVERRPGSRVCDIVDEFEAQMIPHAPHIEDFKAETNRLRSAPKPITFLRIEHVASPKGTPPPNRFPVSYCQVRVVVGKVEKSLWACRTELRALLKPKAADSAINRVYKEEGFPTPWDPMLGVKLPSSIRPLLRPALNQSLSNRPTSLIPGPNLGLKRHPQQGGSFQKEDILRMIDLLQSMLI